MVNKYKITKQKHNWLLYYITLTKGTSLHNEYIYRNNITIQNMNKQKEKLSCRDLGKLKLFFIEKKNVYIDKNTQSIIVLILEI